MPPLQEFAPIPGEPKRGLRPEAANDPAKPEIFSSVKFLTLEQKPSEENLAYVFEFVKALKLSIKHNIGDKEKKMILLKEIMEKLASFGISESDYNNHNQEKFEKSYDTV